MGGGNLFPGGLIEGTCSPTEFYHMAVTPAINTKGLSVLFAPLDLDLAAHLLRIA